MRGRLPVPTALKLIRGDPSHRPIKKAPEVEVVSPTLPAPSFLGKAARARWDAMLPRLVGAGLLTIVDTDLLAHFCLNITDCERFALLARKAEDDGSLEQGSRYRRLQRQHFGDAMRAALALGIGPVSRVRIPAATNQRSSTDWATQIRRELGGA